MAALIPWPEIESFHNIRKYTAASAHPEVLHGITNVFYRPKVKLHGTNAAVQSYLDGTVVVQSRESILTKEKDNAGFARWVSEQEGKNATAWSEVGRVAKHYGIEGGLTVFGEWCGPGIQKGVAISQIPKKVFVVFAARPLDTLHDELIVDPETLRKIVGKVPDTYVLPWYNDGIDIDWSQSSEELTKKINSINEWVASVEANDPWVEEIFGVKGTGEGLVFYPQSLAHIAYTDFVNLVFKAKGEKHKNIATAKPAQVDASVAASVDAFVDMVLTEARLEQGVTKVSPDGTLDLKLTGQFITWVSADVEKETQDELEASGLTWKQVQKAIGDKARNWYLTQAKKR